MAQIWIGADTQVDKLHGREAARKLGRHTTEKQTANYIRHESETAGAAVLPELNAELVARVEMVKPGLAQT